MDPRPTAAVLTEDRFQTPFAKTAHGLIRGPSRFRIVGLIDRLGAGTDAGVLLDGTPRQIPTCGSLDELTALLGARPALLVVGIATSGGVLPAAMKATLLAALRQGVGIVNGLHEFLADDPVFAAEAARQGVPLIDIRRPKPRAELHFWSGRIRQVRAPRIAVLGTDCALGKRTTCQVLRTACEAAGLRTAIVHTGQTGWLQGIPHGFVLDSTPNDFVSGELEHAIVCCDQELRPDVILLEGQSALRNPSGPCGAELLLSGEARGVVLQHAPAREFFEDQEALCNRIPDLRSEVALIGAYGARVLGIALNGEHLDAAGIAAARVRIGRETGLPVVAPLHGGVAELVPVVQAFIGGGTR